MTMELISPLEPLKDRLIEGIRTSTQCLWCVAYVDVAAINFITAALRERLKRSSTFSFRLLYQDYGFRTEPAALVDLIDVFKEFGRRRSLELKWANSRKFHAKVYGFKKGGREQVILGSGNLTEKAISGLGSGELMVGLNGRYRSNVWAELEAFWDDGTPATPQWLKKYETAYTQNLKLQKAAERGASKWKKGDRVFRPKKPPADLWNMPIYVQHVVPLDREAVMLIDKQAAYSKREQGIAVPVGYTAYSSPEEAHALPKGTPILEISWRNEEDAYAGLQSIKLTAVKRVIPIGNQKLGRHWLVCSQAYRGEKNIFNNKVQARIEKILKNNQLTLKKLYSNGDGYLRGRKDLFRVVYRALKALS